MEKVNSKGKHYTTPYVTEFVGDGIVENPLPHLRYKNERKCGDGFSITGSWLQQKWIIQEFKDGKYVNKKEEWRDVPTE